MAIEIEGRASASEEAMPPFTEQHAFAIGPGLGQVADQAEMLRLSVLRERGWTPALVAAFLGDPDALETNPHYRTAPPMRLRAVARVEAAEASPEFSAAKEKAAMRSAGAKKGVETRREALLRQVREMDVSVGVLPLDEVRRLAVEAYNARNFWGVDRDAPADFVERIMVNFVRHELTVYDEALDAAAGKVGVSAAVAAIRGKVFDAIAAAYPALASECGGQRQVRSTRGGA